MRGRSPGPHPDGGRVGGDTGARARHPAARKLAVGRPVDRLRYIESHAAGRRVLDLGCLDATAQSKRGTGLWLHERIGRVAASLTGLDNSPSIPPEGLDTPFSTIVRGDVMAIDPKVCGDPEVIVAGELLEHVPDPLAFVCGLRRRFPGRTLVLTTPNATGVTNVLLGIVRRESTHPDHLFAFSFTTLTRVMERAGVEDAQIVPYHVSYGEAKLSRRGFSRAAVAAAERVVRVVERAVPMWSTGWIVVARL